MKKELLVFLVLSLMVFGVFAAGSSTGSVAADEQANKTRENADFFRTNEVAKAKRNCEDVVNRTDRITCRLDYIKENRRAYVAPLDSIPESCRNLSAEKKAACRVFYQKSAACFEQEGRAKNKCFKRIANFVRAKLKDENPSERGAKARDYIVLLLYDLQEKIEGAIESGKVTSEEGALAIDKIVAIKELILQGKSKDEIRPLLVDLRTTIGTLREDIDNE